MSFLHSVVLFLKLFLVLVSITLHPSNYLQSIGPLLKLFLWLPLSGITLQYANYLLQPVAEFVCPARCGAPGTNITADQKRAHEFFESLLSVVFPNIGLSQILITKFNNKLACWRLSIEPK